MKWTVIQLQKYRDNELKIDEIIDVTKELQLRDPEIRSMSPVHVTGTANVDSQKVTFHLRLSGTMILPCSRTLADVEYPIDVHSIETFLLKSYEHEEEDEMYKPENGIINLVPVIEELLLLEIPMQVFCENAQTEEAFLAGKGWEVMTEEQLKLEREKRVDPRLAGLADLFKDNEE